MHKVITGFVLGTLSLACGLVSAACNVPDPGDMDRLLEALAEVPAPQRAKMRWETELEKAVEVLEKKDKNQGIGKLECYPKDNSPGWGQGALAIERAEAELPNVEDVLNCLRHGIEASFRSFAPNEVDYALCVTTLLDNAAYAEAKELLRRAKSSDPFEYFLDWPELIDLRGREFQCIPRKYEEFEDYFIYSDADRPKTLVEVKDPKPAPPMFPPEDEDDDDYGVIDVLHESFDAAIARDTRIIKMLFTLEKPPPMIKKAIAQAAAAAAVDATLKAFVALICLDANQEWGCASAPGLPGYDGPGDGPVIVTQPAPGGDK